MNKAEAIEKFGEEAVETMAKCGNCRNVALQGEQGSGWANCAIGIYGLPELDEDACDYWELS